ncbi:MAG: purine-nucleoside phosphorylase [Ruminococcaceae bacterium]|nr:purine-nucleoside phosphorylase [Oscillospiraceae bacterium]
MATPHIKAEKGDFAKTVIMPGDPLRAQHISENFLTDAVLVNNVRGISGFTGTYKGKTVSVMASGMGMPSMGIYSYELFNFFDVENIIRVGSAGSMRADIKLRELIIALSASTDSNYMTQYGLPGFYAPTAAFSLVSKAVETAGEQGFVCHVGNVLTSDSFYHDDPESNKKWRKMGVMCVEMETAALYMNAARAGKNALSILTVSDSLITGEATDSDERQVGFNKMIALALDVAVKL